MDGNKRPKNYELKARQTIGIKIESSASAKIGVVSFLCLALSWLGVTFLSMRAILLRHCGFLEGFMAGPAVLKHCRILEILCNCSPILHISGCCLMKQKILRW